MRKRKANPELVDEEIPEWTDADFKRTRPAAAVLPEILGEDVAARLLKTRGRPKSPDAKVAISLRLPPETLSRWKAGGPGWQTRMADALTQVAPRGRRRSRAANDR